MGLTVADCKKMLALLFANMFSSFVGLLHDSWTRLMGLCRKFYIYMFVFSISNAIMVYEIRKLTMSYDSIGGLYLHAFIVSLSMSFMFFYAGLVFEIFRNHIQGHLVVPQRSRKVKKLQRNL
ncbi:hypothetical protein AWZ03_014485 [Drosophila navojoa]|uniref:Uncharacterized protein n=1 Tax=Drosophila navojoa TaxID=7232 RepID=A0A484AU71_DRONA|nr:hypothetical protein AWZ03_014485 [Drosophila navojoa]